MDKHTFDLALESISTDRQSGASELARRCLAIIAESAYNASSGNTTELIQLLKQRAAQLVTIRPTMAPIENLLGRWHANTNLLPETELTVMREQAAVAANNLIKISRQAVQQCATLTAEYIGPNKTLFTHSLSSTVSEVFKALKDQGTEAIITESRPLNEGHLLAKQLSEWRIPTTLITDAQIGLFIAKADAVIVGADTLLANGDLINKAGTYPLALMAHEHGIPFYVCCESFKQRTDARGEPKLEMMDIAELQAPRLPGVTIQNIYFDITPARMINIWFDENRIHRYDP